MNILADRYTLTSPDGNLIIGVEWARWFTRPFLRPFFATVSIKGHDARWHSDNPQAVTDLAGRYSDNPPANALATMAMIEDAGCWLCRANLGASDV